MTKPIYSGHHPAVEWRTIQARAAAERRAEKRRKAVIHVLTFLGAAIMAGLVGGIGISLLERASLGGM